MAYPQGFSYIKGPLNIQEFTQASATTFSINSPVMIDSTGSIIESKATSGYITGFAMSNSSASVPAGKCIVVIPNERTIFASICTTGASAANCASGSTGFHVKSGNTFFFVPSGVSAFGTNLYTIVPREDGSTIDSTDSSVWLVVNGQNLLPFGQSGQPVK